MKTSINTVHVGSAVIDKEVPLTDDRNFGTNQNSFLTSVHRFFFFFMHICV